MGGFIIYTYIEEGMADIGSVADFEISLLAKSGGNSLPLVLLLSFKVWGSCCSKVLLKKDNKHLTKIF